MRSVARNSLILLVLLLIPCVAFAKQYSPEYEAKVGADAAREIEKEMKLWTGPESEAPLKRVDAIVAEIGPHTVRPKVVYSVKLLDTDEANAFSIPGGYVYVTRALLKDVQSDDELAGVLAHEMAHNSTYDALRQLDKGQMLTLSTAAAVLVSVLAGARSEVPIAILQAGGLITRGLLSNYSIDIEREADIHAIDYLMQTKYNPVGLLTFMERLAAQERSQVQIDPGILATHPASVDRCVYMTDILQQKGVFINRRAVSKWDPPVLDTANGVETLKLWGTDLFSFNKAPEGQDVVARGAAMLGALTAALADGAQEYEFKLEQSGEDWQVVWWQQPILTVYPDDAQLSGKSPKDAAQSALDGLRAALRKDFIASLYKDIPPEKPKEASK